MATKFRKTTYFSVREAAELYNRNPSRIRQICLEHDIGYRFTATSARMLTAREVEQIGKIIEKSGYSKAD